MKLTFIGAAHEVTGSCTLLECCGGNFLIDYGMEQGVNVLKTCRSRYYPDRSTRYF